MPKQKVIKPTDLDYLAGLLDPQTAGLRSTNTTNAAVISTDEAYIDRLVKTYGGERKEFVSKAGKKWQGWFLDLPTRINLVKQAIKHTRANPLDLDTVVSKLEKAHNSLGVK